MDNLYINKIIELLGKNTYEINWYIRWFRLSANPNAIHLLEENRPKICWKFLSRNSNAINPTRTMGFELHK